MATSGCFSSPLTSFSISSLELVPPVGLAGLLRMMSRVFGVMRDSTASAPKPKPSFSSSGSGTGVAPVNLMTDS